MSKVYKTVDLIKAKGGKVTREPGPVKGGTTVIAFVEDPDGYKFELIERGATPEPLCQVMLRVGDLDRAIDFYKRVSIILSSNCLTLLICLTSVLPTYTHLLCTIFITMMKAFGMELLRKRDNPAYKVLNHQNKYACLFFTLVLHTSFLRILLKPGWFCEAVIFIFPAIKFVYAVCLMVMCQYTIAMMGYGPEDKNAVLELTYNYGVSEYDKGNAYAQVTHCFGMSI